MIRRAHPVFRKDWRLLLQFMAAALGMECCLILAFTMGEVHGGEWLRRLPGFGTAWLQKMQVAVSVVIALVCAAHWWAEEKEAGNEWFLRRLAASRWRLSFEKSVAGGGIVLLTVLAQFLIAGGFAFVLGRWPWVGEDRIEWILPVLAFLAYGIGLPLSWFLGSSMAVIIVGLGICLGIGFIWSGLHGLEHWLWLTLGVSLLTAGLVGAAAAPGGMGRLGRAIGGREGLEAQRRPLAAIRTLLRKEAKDNLVLSIGAFGIPLCGILGLTGILSGGLIYCALALGVLMSTALGTRTYDPGEKDGLSCVLYHHPVSRSRIYWLKLGWGLSRACVVAVGLLLLLPWLWELESVRTLLTYRDHLDLALFLGVQGWYFPVFFLLLGLIPFLCGTIVTHAVRRSLYALLLGVVAAFGVWGLCLLILFREMCLVDCMAALQNATSVEPVYVPFGFPWTLVFLIGALMLVGWRGAVNRSILTASWGERFVYVIRLFLFALALFVLLTTTGWRDLFYLGTGIDIGAG